MRDNSTRWVKVTTNWRGEAARACSGMWDVNQFMLSAFVWLSFKWKSLSSLCAQSTTSLSTNNPSVPRRMATILLKQNLKNVLKLVFAIVSIPVKHWSKHQLSEYQLRKTTLVCLAYSPRRSTNSPIVLLERIETLQELTSVTYRCLIPQQVLTSVNRPGDSVEEPSSVIRPDDSVQELVLTSVIHPDGSVEEPTSVIRPGDSIEGPVSDTWIITQQIDPGSKVELSIRCGPYSEHCV